MFEVTSFHTFEVMPHTRFCDARTDGQMDGRTDERMERQGDCSIPPNFVFGCILKKAKVKP